MENLDLIARVNRTKEAWDAMSPLTISAYDLLLTEESFWDPYSEVRYTRPMFWQEIGEA